MKKLKVISTNYPKQYPTSSMTDGLRYDLAHLEIEKSPFITISRVLPVKVNWI
jgi:hypothetical protein